MDEELVFDVGERDFETLVVERSRTIPVVVDFWAEWCGPCRTLGPLLESLATEHAGAFLLAKVDIDKAPALANAFGVRSIPMVLGFRDGAAQASFVGALPEDGVRDFLARILPSAAERLAAEAADAHQAGQPDSAEEMFRRAREMDPRCAPASLGLARLLAERGDSEDALALLDSIDPGTPLRPEADRLAARIRVGESAPVDEAALRAKLQTDPDDHESRFALAQSDAAHGRYADALDHYLELVRRDRAFRDDAARKAMLDIFELLGAGDETVEHYRSELATVLFR